MANPLNIEMILEHYAGAESNDPSDTTKIRTRTQESNVPALVRQKVELAIGATDFEVNLAAATCTYLVIMTDQQVTMKLNEVVTPITLRPVSAGVKTMVYFTRGDITEVLLTNPSGKVANLDILSLKK